MSADDTATDVSRAEAFLNMRGEDIRYCTDMGKWFTWDGGRWKLDTMNQVDTWAMQAGITGSDRGQEAFLRSAAKSAHVKVAAAQWDADPFVLACENVTINLRTGMVGAPDRKSLNTKLAPVVYDAAATCPVWDQFLDTIMAGNKHMVAYLQRLMGYCLTGSVADAVMPVFIGVGANGKSTLLRVVQTIMGEYATTASEGLLLAKSHESHPTSLATLMGARLAVSSEIAPGKKLDVARVKQLTGGDIVSARFMFGNEFRFTPTHKLLIQCNHLPRLGDATNGIWRRIQRIEFPVTIPEHERDGNLHEKLMAEASGVLNWLVAGAVEWAATGLRVPPEVREGTEVYRRDDDVNGEFFEASLTFGGEARTSSADVRQAYDRWADRRVAYSDRLSVHDLAASLRERGAVRGVWDSGRVRGWKGVGLTETVSNGSIF